MPLLDRDHELKAQRFREALLELVDARLVQAEANGTVGQILDEPADTAARMAALLPVGNPFDEMIGPFYDIAGAQALLGLSKSGVIKRLNNGEVIAAQLEDSARSWVFPTWQFSPASATLVDGMTEVWKTLLTQADRWTAALWMRARSADLGGVTVVDWLTAGHPVETAIALAQRDAARWAA